MNLREIEVFHAVYVCGSITGAARSLHVSQPSVSKTLRHTEDRLQFQLFKRVKGRLLATAEARLLFREVDDVYQRVGSLKRAVKNIRTEGAGHLRVAVLPALGLSVTPAAIAKFRSKNSGVTFDVQVLDHADMLRCLYENDTDVAIGFEPASHPRLKSVEIGKGELALIHRREVFKRKTGRIDLTELNDVDYIGLTGSGPIGVLLGCELERSNVRVNEVVSVRAFFIAAALVRKAVGVAIIDEFTARAMMGPDLAYNPLSPSIAFGVHCSWLEDRPPSRLCQEFIELLSTVLPDA
jgi:DNA-binding transcriptional LysR family regulator